VRVDVHQPGQHGGVREVDHRVTIFGRDGVRSITHAHNVPALDDDGLVREHLAALGIEHLAGMDDRAMAGLRKCSADKHGTKCGEDQDAFHEDLPFVALHSYIHNCYMKI